MAESPVKIGHLVRLNGDLTVDHSVPGLPIFQGANIIGRNNVSLTDKRVSRKHISLQTSKDGSAEVTVEGPNPIIYSSRGRRKRLSSQEKTRVVHGDIIELIPSEYLFRYEVGDLHALSSETNSRFSRKERRHSEEEVLILKKSRQVEDKTVARSQEIDEVEKNDLNAIIAAKSDEPTMHQNKEAIRDFKVDNKSLPSVFRLMQVQGLPTWANTTSVTIGEVIQGNVHVALLSNYMVDMDWLMSACPGLWKIPHVVVVHGESSGMMDHYKKTKLPNWILHKPPLPISYGTHHTKAMLLVYDKGVRVVVHTANLIYVDWNNKTQGLWMQDFPWKDQSKLNNDSLFEHDLVDYLTTLKWPEFNVKLPVVGNVSFNASFFKKFDYSSAKVRLIASVPGYHTGPNLRKWGHMKLRSVLENCIFDREFRKSPLVYQFSSLGSLDEKWLSEFAVSMSSGVTTDRSPLGIGKPQIIWPTVEDVRCSIEGYAAGNAIPSPQKNVEKEFLKKYWARWKANHVGRCRAMPHVKTYTRYNGQSLAWFLLTSANLSKAAWGALQKNNSQLMIRSYELGVLFLPSTSKSDYCSFSCTGSHDSKQTSKDMVGKETKFATLCRNGNATDDTYEVIRLPVPYQLPPQPYSSEDIPWSWDRRYTKKDVYGEVWPRHVQLYQNQGN